MCDVMPRPAARSTTGSGLSAAAAPACHIERSTICAGPRVELGLHLRLGLGHQPARLQQQIGQQQVAAVARDDRPHPLGQGSNVAVDLHRFLALRCRRPARACARGPPAGPAGRRRSRAARTARPARRSAPAANRDRPAGTSPLCSGRPRSAFPSRPTFRETRTRNPCSGPSVTNSTRSASRAACLASSSRRRR